MRLGIDIDGVLARFDEAYAELITQETGLQFPTQDTDNWPEEWFWERRRLAQEGYSEKDAKAVENKAWEYIKASPFWGSLHAYPGAPDALERLNTLALQGNDVYFITSRPGKLAKFWTETWLMRHGMDRPTVLIAEDKGPVVKGLKLNVFVDDKPENNQDVAMASPKTRKYLVDRPYNQWAQDEDVYGLRVKSLTAALDIEFRGVELKEAA